MENVYQQSYQHSLVKLIKNYLMHCSSQYKFGDRNGCEQGKTNHFVTEIDVFIGALVTRY